MSIYVLVTGVLHKDPITRVSQNGNPYTTFTLRVEQDEQTVWANAICFDEAARAELARLKTGDALSVQGKGTPKVYMKDDEARASLHMTAQTVLPVTPRHEAKPAYEPTKPAYEPKPPPAPVRARPKPAPARPPRADERPLADDGFDDPLDF